MLESLFLSTALAFGQAQLLPPGDILPPAAEASEESQEGLQPEPATLEPAPEEGIVQVKAEDQPGQKTEDISAPLLPAPTPPAAPAAPAAAVAAPPPRWFLMKELQGTWEGGALDSTRTSIMGWFQGSVNASSAGDRNLPELFDYRSNQFMLQQAWLKLNRAVVTSGTTDPTFGFEGDIYFGTDYRFTLARGVFDHQLRDRFDPATGVSFPAEYGFDPVQFYGEAYIPTIAHGLDIKVGRWYCPFGVESIEATANPFLSHSYTFAVGPCFTNTGVLATLTLNPVWTFQAGIGAGNDIQIGNAANSPIGTLTAQWTQPSGGRNIVKAAAMVGTGDIDQGLVTLPFSNNVDQFDVVWTHIFNPVLIYNMEAFCGYAKNYLPSVDVNGNVGFNGGSATWQGLAQYIAYTLSARLTAQARFELFNDPHGVRTAFSGALGDGPQNSVQSKGLYEAVTLGLVFSPRINKSILIRPEIRYDYNDESQPFDGHHGLVTAASDLIIRW